jgi:hypothetical protein
MTQLRKEGYTNYASMAIPCSPQDFIWHFVLQNEDVRVERSRHRASTFSEQIGRGVQEWGEKMGGS